MTASHRNPGKNDVTDPLPIRLRVATNDPEVAGDRLRQTYAGAEIRTPRDDPAFAYRQDVDGDAELSLGRFHFGGRGRVNLVLEDTLTVVRRRTGTHRWEVDGRRGTGLMVIQPHEAYRAELEFLEADSLNLHLPALQDTARAVHGDQDLEVAFDHPRPASPAHAKYWADTFDFAHGILTDPAISTVPLLRADLHRRMAVATLETFRLSGDPRTRRISVAARQTAHRQAVEFMHASLSLPITVEDVARHVGLSTVELAGVFRSRTGITPAAYLRGLRLAAAHQDLVRGTPAGGGTVRAIALRWGFPHAGDFARRHRHAYGENPARTLHE
ncbi:helix-turn-helix transcriptional regulator [Kocuria sp. NPDC057446]|uniref:helix-turn-helix transcriptional regulator n=1 Tax=Kocuria sp. NPDC057446 TaxID=3346137 RepID=UPI003699D23E